MALPTHMQEMAAVLTKAERKMMGRWASDEAYQRYCKDLKGPRCNIAKKVISHLKRAHFLTCGKGWLVDSSFSL